jgi:hypothetical protein
MIALPLLCVDCKFHSLDEIDPEGLTLNMCSFYPDKVDAVTGEVITSKKSCYEMRSTDGACEPEGHLFEPKRSEI